MDTLASFLGESGHWGPLSCSSRAARNLRAVRDLAVRQQKVVVVVQPRLSRSRQPGASSSALHCASSVPRCQLLYQEFCWRGLTVSVLAERWRQAPLPE